MNVLKELRELRECYGTAKAHNNCDHYLRVKLDAIADRMEEIERLCLKAANIAERYTVCGEKVDAGPWSVMLKMLRGTE